MRKGGFFNEVPSLQPLVHSGESVEQKKPSEVAVLSSLLPGLLCNS